MRTVLIFVFIFVSACVDVGGLRTVREDPTDLPVEGLTVEQSSVFARGDALFEFPFRASQGLGPVYIRSSCAACHQNDGRGPGSVERVAAVDRDGITALPEQTALLPWGSVLRPQFVEPATRGVTLPSSPGNLLVSLRIGPAVFGRGWIEAIDETEVERLANEQRQRGGTVRGRVNRLADGRLGRFGVKARVASLVEFAADAFRGDMGLTSPLQPREVVNPEGISDDQHPGIDLSMEQLRAVELYLSALALPRRGTLTTQGRRIFERSGCADCHTPALATRRDYPIAAMAGSTAEVYSDLLLHDMGTALADGIREESAGERDWRTAPLIGLRQQQSFLHDGRASTIEEAIRLHRGNGSEANPSVDAFDALTAEERTTLLDFVRAL